MSEIYEADCRWCEGVGLISEMGIAGVPHTNPCPHCDNGKIRPEVECGDCGGRGRVEAVATGFDEDDESRGSMPCYRCQNGYRPMTRSEVEELKANPFIGDALIDLIKRDIVTYKGQRVRIKGGKGNG